LANRRPNFDAGPGLWDGQKPDPSCSSIALSSKKMESVANKRVIGGILN
jgi:hypothetical protein